MQTLFSSRPASSKFPNTIYGGSYHQEAGRELWSTLKDWVFRGTMSQSQWAFRSRQKLKDVLWGMDYQHWKKLNCPSYLSPEKKTGPKSPTSLVAEPRLELRSLTASDPKLLLPSRGRCVVESNRTWKGEQVAYSLMKNSHWDSELRKGQREVHTHTHTYTLLNSMFRGRPRQKWECFECCLSWI